MNAIVDLDDAGSRAAMFAAAFAEWERINGPHSRTNVARPSALLRCLMHLYPLEHAVLRVCLPHRTLWREALAPVLKAMVDRAVDTASFIEARGALDAAAEIERETAALYTLDDWLGGLVEDGLAERGDGRSLHLTEEGLRKVKMWLPA